MGLSLNYGIFWGVLGKISWHFCNYVSGKSAWGIFAVLNGSKLLCGVHYSRELARIGFPRKTTFNGKLRGRAWKFQEKFEGQNEICHKHRFPTHYIAKSIKINMPLSNQTIFVILLHCKNRFHQYVRNKRKVFFSVISQETFL